MQTAASLEHVVKRPRFAHPSNDQEALAVVARHPELSCLRLEPTPSGLGTRELLSASHTSLHRSQSVFEQIRALLAQYRLSAPGVRYIFHCKDDSCSVKTDFAVLANSRKAGSSDYVLWPLLMQRPERFKRVKNNLFLHDEINQYVQQPDARPWEHKQTRFVFRGMNSGNPFCSVTHPWDTQRGSRLALIKAASRLGADLRGFADVGFDNLYPRAELAFHVLRGLGTPEALSWWVDRHLNPFYPKGYALRRRSADVGWIERRFGQMLSPGASLSDVQADIRMALSALTKPVARQSLYAHKFHFCPEGFDYSSASYWVLASSCVAICPPFTVETLIVNPADLKPYTHYIPINKDYGNLAEVMRWCLDHDRECAEIAENSKRYASPLLDEASMKRLQVAALRRILQ